MLGNKIGAALAAGNAVIVKWPETNPFSTLLASSLSIQAGIPPGVLNGFTGGVEVGVALPSPMRIRKPSFAGSLAAARHIQVAAAKSKSKNMVLEIGGKSTIIVFSDANIEEAAKACSQFLTLNGQVCMLATGVYLHEDIAKTILHDFQKILDIQKMDLGSNSMEKGTWSSPLLHKAQQQTVLNIIETGKKEAILFRGGVTIGEKGCFIKPAVIENPVPHAEVLKEEIFGPVVVVSIFKTEEEVLEGASDSEYVLGAFR